MSGCRTVPASRPVSTSLATLAGLTGLLASGVLIAGVGPVTGAEIRTETTLGGYSIDTNAAPFKVLLDDPTLPIPRPPDSAVVEADPAYSHAVLDAGPTARGVGSVLWPGALIGDGVGTITEGEVESYPLKAEARYPDRPYIATNQDGGAIMRGEALGLDVMGMARMTPADDPTGQLDVGFVSSKSTATVKDGVAVGTSVSRVTDVSLLGGIIKVGSVSTTLTVKSDGKKGASAGSTVVTGLEIGGVGFVVDEQGARPVGVPAPGSGPLPTGAGDPLKALGITVSGISQDATQDANNATRDAKGLRITVDTAILHSALDNVPSPITDAVYGLISQLPKEIQGYVFYAVSATPKITFILGAGQGRSAATLPLSFSFPPLPPMPPTDFGGPVGSDPLGGAVDPGPGLGGVGTVVPPAGTGNQGPTVAGPSLRPVAEQSEDPFSGIPPSLLLLVAASAGLAGWGLTRLSAGAMVVAVAGPCPISSTSALPDLRGA